MKTKTAEVIRKAAEELELEVGVREHYSGRGMYGKTTAAIEMNSVSEFMRAVALASHNETKKGDQAFEAFFEDVQHGFSSDVMGLGKVFY